MADTLSINVKASLDWLFKESLNLSTISDVARLEYAASMGDGTGLRQVDKLWHAERTLASGFDDDLDLSALAQTVYGSTVTIRLVKVKGLLIVNLATASGEDLLIGGSGGLEWFAAFGAAGNKVRCPAESCLLLSNKVAGWNVADGVNEVLRVKNVGAGPVTYRIVIAGTSA